MSKPVDVSIRTIKMLGGYVLGRVTGQGPAQLLSFRDLATALSKTGLISGGGGGGASALSDLSDVELTSPTDGEVLTYVDTDGKWENKPASGGGGGGAATTHVAAFAPVNVTNSGSSYAFKGVVFIPDSDMWITAIGGDLLTVVSASYKGMVAPLNGATTTPTINDDPSFTDAFTATDAKQRIVWVKFSTAVKLTAGNAYALAIGRTDSTDTYALPINAPTNVSRWELPGQFVEIARIAKANPSNGDSVDTNSGSLTTWGFAVEWSLTDPSSGGGSGPTPSDDDPLMDGTAAPGTSTDYSRADHVHPTDTSAVHIADTETITGAKTFTNNAVFQVDSGLPISVDTETTTGVFQATRYINSTGGPVFFGKKSRGSRDTPTAVQNGDTLIGFRGYGYDGSSFGDGNQQSAILLESNEDWVAGTSWGTRARFLVTPNGSTTLTEVLRADGVAVTFSVNPQWASDPSNDDDLTRKSYVDGLFASGAGFLSGISRSSVNSAVTFALTDVNKVIDMNITANRAITIPQNSSVAIPIGSVIGVAVRSSGSFGLTWTTTGVTVLGSKLTSAPVSSTTASSYIFIKIDTDTWLCIASQPS